MSVATNFVGFCFVVNLKALGAVTRSSSSLIFFVLLQKLDFGRSVPQIYIWLVFAIRTAGETNKHAH